MLRLCFAFANSRRAWEGMNELDQAGFQTGWPGGPENRFVWADIPQARRSDAIGIALREGSTGYASCDPTKTVVPPTIR